MPQRFFHTLDDANDNSVSNAFEDWFAANGVDIGAQAFLQSPNNAANGGAPLTGAEGPLEAAATAVPAASPLHYFLKVGGITGDATLKGFEGWIAVDGFDWGIENTRTVGSAGGGAGAGKASFSALTVDIHSLSALTALFSDAARGVNLGTVELAAVDTIKGQSLKVYDLKLSDVVVGSFENDPGPNGVETAVAFDFAKADVTVRPPTNNGGPGVPQTAEFDATTATTDVLASGFAASAITTTTVPLESAATLVPANSPLKYFLKVGGATGDATQKGFEGWFAVDGFDWGVENTGSVTSAGGGGGAGKTSFSPLTIDIHSLSGLAALFSDAARGENLGTVELAAVDTIKGETLKVYDLKLSDVLVSGFENDPGPNGIETEVAFNFTKASVMVQPPTNNGRLGVPQAAEFDLTTLKTTDVLASGASAVTTSHVPLASAATLVPANSPLHYFLKVNGVTGDATQKGFAGWFAVDGFDWGVENTTRIGSAGGGAGAGKTSFSPLTVDIHSLSGLASLFSDAARGENLGTIELAAVDTIKGQTLKVYDLKLSDVILSGFENDPGPNGIETALAFDFAKAAVTVQPPTNNGRPGAPQTGEFDLTTLTAAAALASNVSASVVSTTAVPLASAATPVPANSPLQYFLKVNGVTGDATLKGFAGWIEVDGFDWGVENPNSVTSAGGGAGVGKTTFSPFTVDIHSLSGLASLFSDAARGENLGTVELAAVDTIKGQSLKVYDLKLSDVIVSGFENDPGPKGIETALAFDFAKAAVTVQPTTRNGRVGVPQTGEFDLTTLTATDALASAFSASAATTTQVPLASAATLAPANSPLKYFLKVNGATGDATQKGFAGWFAVDGFDWGVENTRTLGSAGGGAGAGKTSFSPLTVDIHSLSGLAALFSDAARGGNLGTVELAAVETIKGQSLKVYDLKLSDVVLTGFENDPGANGIETALGFDFAKAAVTVQPTTNNGRVGVPQTGEFDLTTLKTTDALASNASVSAITTTQIDTTHLSLASAATPVPANSPLQYFLKVNGATGDATLKGFTGWFAVDGFDWGVEHTGSAASSGAGAGKASFSPLTVDIHSLSGLAALFSDAAQGKNLGTVELAAVETIKGQSLKVYDIKLSDVVLTGFENDPGAHGIETALGFDFAKASVTTRPPTLNGRPGAPQTVGVDLTTLQADFAPGDLVFNPPTSGAGLLAPATIGSSMPQDPSWRPTLTSGH